MKPDNLFDKALKIREASGSTSAEVLDSAVWVTDTLDLCWASAQAIFEDKATPEMALALFDRLIDNLDGDDEDEDDGEDIED